jgi:hypothetical protein
MLSISRWFGVLLLVSLSGAPAAGEGPDVDVADVWVSATIGPTRTSALYLRIHNRGLRTERLLAAETPVAEKVGFHINVRDRDVLRMRGASAIEIPPGETVIMRRGGLHGMLLGVQHPLKDGQSVPLTLLFEAAGKVEVVAEVRGFGRARP